MIEYDCPACGARMASPASMAGREETCPVCSSPCRVPVPTGVACGPPTGVPGSAYASQYAGRPVVTERTAKNLKLQVALSTVLFLAGAGATVILMIGGGGLSVIVAVAAMLAGAIWRIIAGVRIWWHHG